MKAYTDAIKLLDVENKQQINKKNLTANYTCNSFVPTTPDQIGFISFESRISLSLTIFTSGKFDYVICFTIIYVMPIKGGSVC